MSRRVLPVIVAAQFAGTSLWFAGNAVIPDIAAAWTLPDEVLGSVTSAVQLGFIAGTLLSAIFTLTDRVPARVVFALATVLGAAANLLPLVQAGLTPLLASRFVVGLALAGIYPVGMKLAASWFEEGLSQALGWLVGALVLGTAAPHLIRGLGAGLPWTEVLLTVSALAVVGGVAVLALVPEGPHVRPSSGFNPRALFELFSEKRFRSAAFGYFGHQWELYAFWSVVPILVSVHSSQTSLGAAIVIGLGAVGCVIGGRLALRQGSAKIAALQLATSGTLALTAPLWMLAPSPVALGLLGIWGITVVGDSPQYSTLTALNAPRRLVGSGLTIVTCVGFGVTVGSIELINSLRSSIDVATLMPLLAVGPALGLWALRGLREQKPAPSGG